MLKNTLKNISTSLSDYLEKVKLIHVPDVLELNMSYGGQSDMGRRVFTTGVAGTYYNKSKVHKKYKGYVGHPHLEFYQQNVVEIATEQRILVVKEIPNTQDTQINTFAYRLKRSFNHQLTDYVLDVYKKPDDTNWYIMELNEIHLSTITPEEFEYILNMVML